MLKEYCEKSVVVVVHYRELLDKKKLKQEWKSGYGKPSQGMLLQRMAQKVANPENADLGIEK